MRLRRVGVGIRKGVAERQKKVVCKRKTLSSTAQRGMRIKGKRSAGPQRDPANPSGGSEADHGQSEHLIWGEVEEGGDGH